MDKYIASERIISPEKERERERERERRGGERVCADGNI